jgi:hypothetical protein
MPVIADVAAGPIVLIFGLIVGGGLLLLLTLVEAVVLRLLRWGSFGRSVLDSLLMNMASALVGFVLSIFAGNLWQTCGYDPNRGGRWCEWLISPWVLLVLAWLLSELIEGGVLLLRGHHPPRRTWLAALACNIVSYVGFGLLLLASGASL